jgi:hypothetical protein
MDVFISGALVFRGEFHEVAPHALDGFHQAHGV